MESVGKTKDIKHNYNTSTTKANNKPNRPPDENLTYFLNPIQAQLTHNSSDTKVYTSIWKLYTHISATMHSHLNVTKKTTYVII